MKYSIIASKLYQYYNLIACIQYLIMMMIVICLSVYRSIFDVNLYLSVSTVSFLLTNTVVVCCCHRCRVVFTLHQPHFVDTNRNKKHWQGHIHTSSDDQKNVCFRTQVFFSLFLSLLFCLSRPDNQRNKMQILLSLFRLLSLFFFFSFSFFSYVFFSYTQSFGDCYCFEKMDINIVWVFN